MEIKTFQQLFHSLQEMEKKEKKVSVAKSTILTFILSEQGLLN